MTILEKLKKFRDEINARRVKRGLLPRISSDSTPVAEEMKKIIREYCEDKSNSRI